MGEAYKAGPGWPAMVAPAAFHCQYFLRDPALAGVMAVAAALYELCPGSKR